MFWNLLCYRLYKQNDDNDDHVFIERLRGGFKDSLLLFLLREKIQIWHLFFQVETAT